MASYAIISLGGKQYRVQEGQKLLVDRLQVDEGKTFTPTVLFTGGDGAADFSPKDVQVTARVLSHVLGDKIVVGKYKQRTGYRRHNGHRSRLSQVAIESIGKKASRAKKTEDAPAEEAAEKKPARAKKETTDGT